MNQIQVCWNDVTHLINHPTLICSEGGWRQQGRICCYDWLNLLLLQVFAQRGKCSSSSLQHLTVILSLKLHSVAARLNALALERTSSVSITSKQNCSTEHLESGSDVQLKWIQCVQLQWTQWTQWSTAALHSSLLTTTPTTFPQAGRLSEGQRDQREKDRQKRLKQAEKDRDGGQVRKDRLKIQDVWRNQSREKM